MSAVSRKAKQLLVPAAKLLIVAGAFYFIWIRLSKERIDWQRLGDAATGKSAAWLISLILLLTVLNRFFEILKWQALVSWLQPLPLRRSTEQVLAAVTAAIFTPNGVGEYAAKALYYRKDQTKDIIFLNLVCNGVQLIIAVVCGLTGLAVFNSLYNSIPNSTVFAIIGGIAALLIFLFVSRKITIKGYSVGRLFEKIGGIPKQIQRRNMLLALGRYLCIIHQHYFLFLLFGVDLPYGVMISAIAGIYFLGSAVPNFQMIDFAVRGSVAVYFFGTLGVNEWIVVLAATLQWLLNIVLPVIVGSWFVFRFKPTGPHRE